MADEYQLLSQQSAASILGVGDAGCEECSKFLVPVASYTVSHLRRHQSWHTKCVGCGHACMWTGVMFIAGFMFRMQSQALIKKGVSKTSFW